jgi:hypothetical protein
MNDVERAKWQQASDHIAAAFELLADLDNSTSGQQQHSACMLASLLLQIGPKITYLLESPTDQDQPPMLVDLAAAKLTGENIAHALTGLGVTRDDAYAYVLGDRSLDVLMADHTNPVEVAKAAIASGRVQTEHKP